MIQVYNDQTRSKRVHCLQSLWNSSFVKHVCSFLPNLSLSLYDVQPLVWKDRKFVQITGHKDYKIMKQVWKNVLDLNQKHPIFAKQVLILRPRPSTSWKQRAQHIKLVSVLSVQRTQSTIVNFVHAICAESVKKTML